MNLTIKNISVVIPIYNEEKNMVILDWLIVKLWTTSSKCQNKTNFYVVR
jgi:hypothetical protein